MTKEELEKEAEEYALNQWEGNLPWSVIQKSYYDGALPREKQIQIDAEQIRALQKQNGELTDKVKELEKENIELKTKKIPQLERRIASIRGSHRVDVKKLNARIEQVEQLKKENAELKEKYAKNITDCDICDTYCNSQLTKAKELLKRFIELENCTLDYDDIKEAEQFISEVEK